MKYIKPGVCGICGCAVVQPENIESGWHSGHLFKSKLKDNQTKYSELYLVKVRCMLHKENSDPRFYDVDGNVKNIRDIEFPYYRS